MASTFLNTLSAMTRKHIELSETRRQTLCWLIFLIMRYSTVNLWRLAAHAPSKARTDSVRRRFYRFFQFIHIGECSMARMVVALTGLSGKPWTLTIDRTNWDFGKSAVNILMVAVVWNGIGIPLICSVLPKKGNSSTVERTQLLDRLREIFPDMKVAMLLGDREFIGGEWMRYLIENNIYFVMRLRDNQLVSRTGYETWPLSRLAQSLKPGDVLKLKEKCRLKDGPLVRIIMKRLATGELLILACPSKLNRALAVYRERWTIETLFGNLKTRGFDLEATHLSNRKKLATLIAIVSIALTLAAKAGSALSAVKPVPVKRHGHPAVSIFALGLTALKRMFAMPDDTLDQEIFDHVISNRPLAKPKLSNAFSARV